MPQELLQAAALQVSQGCAQECKWPHPYSNRFGPCHPVGSQGAAQRSETRTLAAEVGAVEPQATTWECLTPDVLSPLEGSGVSRLSGSPPALGVNCEAPDSTLFSCAGPLRARAGDEASSASSQARAHRAHHLRGHHCLKSLKGSARRRRAPTTTAAAGAGDA